MPVNNLKCELKLETLQRKTGGGFDLSAVCAVFAPPTEYTITSDEPNHPPCAAVLDEGH